jgi:hypothetical protein
MTEVTDPKITMTPVRTARLVLPCLKAEADLCRPAEEVRILPAVAAIRRDPVALPAPAVGVTHLRVAAVHRALLRARPLWILAVSRATCCHMF